ARRPRWTTSPGTMRCSRRPSTSCTAGLPVDTSRALGECSEMSDDWPVTGTLLAFRYRLVSRLETGGMAEIWHAQDELLARPVALKLPTGLDRPRTDVLRLAWKEARMGARLSHPNIAAVHDYD